MEMPQNVIDLFNDMGALKYLATTDRTRNVELMPLGTIFSADAETLAFGDVSIDSKAKQNLETMKKATAMVFKPPMFAYQAKGVFQGWQTSGPVYDKAAAIVKEKGGAKLNAVGTMKLTEIFAASPANASDKTLI